MNNALIIIKICSYLILKTLLLFIILLFIILLFYYFIIIIIIIYLHVSICYLQRQSVAMPHPLVRQRALRNLQRVSLGSTYIYLNFPKRLGSLDIFQLSAQALQYQGVSCIWVNSTGLLP